MEKNSKLIVFLGKPKKQTTMVVDYCFSCHDCKDVTLCELLEGSV